MILWPVITAAGLLGLMSSAHCIGMCGPLAMALPVHHLSGSGQLLSMLFYHLGRIFTYTVLGLLFGLAGRGLYLAGFQQWFSIGTGIIMLLLAVHYFSGRSKGYPRWIQGWYLPLQQLMGRLLKNRNARSFLFLGMANGLLPCGMVYIAIIGAIGLSEPLQSAAFMLFFGLGTFPAMFLLSWFGIRISLDVRLKLKQAVPFIIAAMGIILILRGMNLGIPFISPVLGSGLSPAADCH
jgi:sulfite exporter TauE/SafE